MEKSFLFLGSAVALDGFCEWIIVFNWLTGPEQACRRMEAFLLTPKSTSEEGHKLLPKIFSLTQ
jgi:hypothetical protein